MAFPQTLPRGFYTSVYNVRAFEGYIPKLQLSLEKLPATL